LLIIDLKMKLNIYIKFILRMWNSWRTIWLYSESSTQDLESSWIQEKFQNWTKFSTLRILRSQASIQKNIFACSWHSASLMELYNRWLIFIVSTCNGNFFNNATFGELRKIIFIIRMDYWEKAHKFKYSNDWNDGKNISDIS
jgi:hypothetical protein